MMRVHPFHAAALMLIVPLVGCQAKSPVQPPADPINDRSLAPAVQADARVLVEANNRFAIDLYTRLRDQPGNLFLSPYSMSTAFGMAYAGAAGSTQAEMAKVFRFELPSGRLHATFGELRRSLDRGTRSGAYELRTANRAWGQKGLPFIPGFLEVTREQYGAQMQEADFIHESEPARLEVNGWVAGQTNDRIRDLFPGGSINAYTRLVLANAIYFKGLWNRPFDPKNTVDAPFHFDPVEAAMVPTMVQEDAFRTAVTDEVQVLELFYRGQDLSMVVVLPRQMDGLARVEEGLTWEKLSAWLAPLAERTLEVHLPSFKFGSKFELPLVLSGMGMPTAFTEAADFSGIDGRNDLHIAAAFHQSFVEVNEEGTEAAAATGISVGATSVRPSFYANHPFLFLIRDHVTGSVLFLGRVIDPRT